jgi:nucleotide-binding universal stress UspA family protein
MHVLVGVDGSPASTGALLTALRLFGDSIAALTIAIVLDYDGDLSNVALVEQERAQKVLRENAKVAAEYLGDAPQTISLVGRPADALVQYARDAKCDLLVIAPRGHGASRFLFGSVASHLARGVGIPVAILPPVGD